MQEDRHYFLLQILFSLISTHFQDCFHLSKPSTHTQNCYMFKPKIWEKQGCTFYMFVYFKRENLIGNPSGYRAHVAQKRKFLIILYETETIDIFTYCLLLYYEIGRGQFAKSFAYYVRQKGGK